MPELKNVEIFAEGTWNGNVITSEILKDIVSAFDATKGFVKPVLKLGHNQEQELLKKDGLPAAGWVSNVYISGKKLLADFIDIPDKIYELIKRRAYRKVSVEIFNGYSFDGKTYPNLLGAVALLGADMPAVMTLSDIMDRYKLDPKTIGESKVEIKVFTKDVEEEDMPEKTTEIKNDEIEKKLLSFQKIMDESKKENEDLKKEFNEYKKKSDAEISTLKSQKNEAEIEKFTLDLRSKELVSSSMEPYVKALAGAVSKTEFTVADKKLSFNSALEELLKLAKETAKINKKEFTKQETEEDRTKDTKEKIEKEIKEYMKENKCDYGTAYRQVSKKNKK